MANKETKNYFFPFNANADLSEPIKNITNDTINTKNNIAKITGEKIGFCWNFLTARIKPAMYKIIKESEYKIKEIDKRLEDKYNQIPDQNKVEPRLSIVGPAIDVLKYNLDQEHIKELFTNLLASEMDDRKQDKILPGFIETINQLSKEDAKFLKYLYKNKSKEISIIYINLENKECYCEISKKIVINKGKNTYDILKYNELVMDNLERLGLIKINPKIYPDIIKDCDNVAKEIAKEIIENSKKQIESNCELIPMDITYYRNEIKTFKITPFGNQFIDICCS